MQKYINKNINNTMDKLEFMKLDEGDTIYVPFVITEKRGDTVVEAESQVVICGGDDDNDGEPCTSLFGYHEILCAEKKRRKFKNGDFVRFTNCDGHSYETRVIKDETPDGMVELPSIWKDPCRVRHEDLKLLVPAGATKYLPEWPDDHQVMEEIEISYSFKEKGESAQ